MVANVSQLCIDGSNDKGNHPRHGSEYLSNPSWRVDALMRLWDAGKGKKLPADFDITLRSGVGGPRELWHVLPTSLQQARAAKQAPRSLRVRRKCDAAHWHWKPFLNNVRKEDDEEIIKRWYKLTYSKLASLWRSLVPPLCAFPIRSRRAPGISLNVRWFPHSSTEAL